MRVRAKFVVTQEIATWGSHGESRKVHLDAVCADEIPENQRYHKATPSGELDMQIDNPEAAEVFKAGTVFYVDFTPVEKATPSGELGMQIDNPEAAEEFKAGTVFYKAGTVFYVDFTPVDE